VPKWRIVLLCVVAAPLVLFGIASIAWAIDTHNADGEVSRGVELAGTDISGESRKSVEKTVDELAEKFPDTKITIDAGEFEMTTTAAQLGVTVDRAATLASTMDVGRAEHGPVAPLRWVKSLVTADSVPVELTIDRAAALAEMARLEGDRRTAPVEPTITADDSGVKVVAGTDGKGIDVDAVLADLPVSVDHIGGAVKIGAEQVTTEPRVSDDDVAKLAATAEANTAKPIKVTIGDQTKDLDATKLRGGFRVSSSPEGPRLSLDPEATSLALVKLFPLEGNPTGVTFDLVNGAMTPKPGHDAVICCADTASAALGDAILSGKTEVKLEARTMTAAEGVEWAKGLGINGVIGEFTTKHPAGQPRVSNIHRISDLTRGQLIPPGGTFSVNDFVGKRTPEKGFVVAPVIEDGEFTEDVGGGISQYATTLFNASFFGGLDIPDYKAHSVYISRYPFGREATLAYPGVDLKIRNNTPYGVVIWPTYTANSVTVQLYSTRYATGEQTAQSPTSGCGKVNTTRTRTFVDGHSDSQVFRANYDCDPPEHH